MDKYINFICDDKNIALACDIAQLIPAIAELDPSKEYFLDRDYHLVNAFFSAVRFDNFDKLNNEEYEESRIWIEEPNKILGEWNTNIVEIIVSGQPVRTTIETLKKCNYYKQVFENFDGIPLPLDMSIEAFKEILRYLRNSQCKINKRFEDEMVYLQINYKNPFKTTGDKDIKITPMMNKPLITEEKNMDEVISLYLNSNPEVTFNKSIHKRHTTTQKESKILVTTEIDGDHYFFSKSLNDIGFDHLLRGLFCKMEGMNYMDVYNSIERISIAIDDVVFLNLSGEGLNLENRAFKDNHEKSGGLTYLFVLSNGVTIPLVAMKNSPKILNINIKFKKTLKRKFILGGIHNIIGLEEKAMFEKRCHEYLHKPLIDTSIRVTKGEKTIIEFSTFDNVLKNKRKLNESDLLQTPFEAFFYIMKPTNGFADINGSLKVTKLDAYTGTKINSLTSQNADQITNKIDKDIRKYIKNHYDNQNSLKYNLYAINRLQSKEFIELEYDYDLPNNTYASIFSFDRYEHNHQPTGSIEGFSYCFEIIPEFTGELILCSKMYRILRIVNGKSEWVNKFEGWNADYIYYNTPLARGKEEKTKDNNKR